MDIKKFGTFSASSQTFLKHLRLPPSEILIYKNVSTVKSNSFIRANTLRNWTTTATIGDVIYKNVSTV